MSLLSNLRVLPNLLADGGPGIPAGMSYEHAIYSCTMWEILDFKRREEALFHRERLTQDQRCEYLALTSQNGNPIPRMTTDGRSPGWLESLAVRVGECVAAIEERPTAEDAFELLLVTRQLYHTLPADNATGREQAAAWDRRVREVLARPEFRFTPGAIDQRLACILDCQLADPNPREPLPGAGDRPAAPVQTPASPPADTPPTPAHSEVALVAVLASVDPPASVPVPTKPGGKRATRTAPRRPVTEPAASPAVPATAVAPPPAEPRVTTAHTPPRTEADPEFARVAGCWPTLPEHVKKCILLLVDAAAPGPRVGKE